MLMQNTLFNVLVVAVITSPLYAEVHVEEFTDAESWESAVGDFDTIDFTGGEHMTLIGDDYADSHGVTFTDNSYYWESDSSFPDDGWGLYGPGGSWLEFDEPQMWIAADHPGILYFDLYYQGELIYASNQMGGSGVGHFSGVVSSEPFDEVHLHKSIYYWMWVDNVHFGTIPAPGALGLLAFAALLGRSRRRTVRTAS